ncbi:hypothetical protein PAT3040_05258 [Paenibacillus agaridevorans]|uniref:Uncharacterized protein n=1 Tax=Paenibacillus agaridevorans TaxID=171404 RepID=A0A2R5EVD0_9BACL|nr:hypothetical protein [Paenibacillus agaridevorans]GBG10517.1 hypothetical protein PAT3040_05258 [Paenibacillus agaridevorans]
MNQQNQFINGIFSALGGITGGLLTFIGVNMTLNAQRKQKAQENIEANRALRITYQLVVLNMLDQMERAFEAEMLDQQDPNIIGYLPNQFIVPMETLIRNINDSLFPTDADLLFRKITMIQNIYYSGGSLRSDVNKLSYKKHIALIYDNILSLNDLLKKKHMSGNL